MLFVGLVGRTLERPNAELFYWLEGTDGELVEVSRPGNRSRRFVGRASDFRRYGQAMAAVVNPALDGLPYPDLHRVRERLVRLADHCWDTFGLAEERRHQSTSE